MERNKIDTIQAYLEPPRECSSIPLVPKRICTNSEKQEVISDYRFSLHLLFTIVVFSWLKVQNKSKKGNRKQSNLAK